MPQELNQLFSIQKKEYRTKDCSIIQITTTKRSNMKKQKNLFILSYCLTSMPIEQHYQNQVHKVHVLFEYVSSM